MSESRPVGIASGFASLVRRAARGSSRTAPAAPERTRCTQHGLDQLDDEGKTDDGGERRGGGRAWAVRVDSADHEAVWASVAGAAGHFGRLDILVNNAGAGVLGPFEGITLADVDRVLWTHVRGPSWQPRPRRRICPRAGA